MALIPGPPAYLVCDRCPRNDLALTIDPDWGGHVLFILALAAFGADSVDPPSPESEWTLGQLCDNCIHGTPTQLGGLNFNTWLATRGSGGGPSTYPET